MDDLLADWGRKEGRKFIIVSDDARFWNLPFNASLVPMAFCELQSLVRKKLGRRHQINVPEDLPLLLPQYPVLFEDYVEGNRELETIALEWRPVPPMHRFPPLRFNAYPSPYSNIHTLIHFNDGYQNIRLRFLRYHSCRAYPVFP